MNVLDQIKFFCYEANIPAPTSITPDTDPAVNQLRHLYLAVGRALVSAKCWPQLKKNHSFTTVNGTDTYALPADYESYVLETGWDRTNQRSLIGPISDVEYNRLKYGIVSGPDRTTFRIYGLNSVNQIQLFPTPGSTNLTISFDYLSNYWIYASGTATWGTSITLDTNTVAFDDDLMILGLKWKWYQAKGLEYLPYKEEFEETVQTAQARWQGNVRVGLSPSDNYRYLNIREGSWSV